MEEGVALVLQQEEEEEARHGWMVEGEEPHDSCWREGQAIPDHVLLQSSCWGEGEVVQFYWRPQGAVGWPPLCRHASPRSHR